jgi:hypothetical protein
LPLASRPFLSGESFCPAALGIGLNLILYAWPPLPQPSKCCLRQGRRSVPQWRIWKEPLIRVFPNTHYILRLPPSPSSWFRTKLIHPKLPLWRQTHLIRYGSPQSPKPITLIH